MEAGAGQNLPVAVDFDHTLIHGDVQEAILAKLVRSGLLTAARVPATLSPSFRLPGQRLTRLHACADVTTYYEALLSPTAHGASDPTPLANGYAWAVEVLDNLRLSDVVDATRASCDTAGLPPSSAITASLTARALPPLTFRPEMVELVAELIRRRFDVWIVSASNVWSVRWMVLRELNPQLRMRGLRRVVPPDHVIGIATLLADKQGHLYKDTVLVREDATYAQLEARALERFRLTSRLQFPVPTYSGKVACILDALGRPPHLGIGDSPSDHAMLRFSQHRLWIAREDQPASQRQVAALISKTGPAGWLVQATTGRPDRFVPQLEALPKSLQALPMRSGIETGDTPPANGSSWSRSRPNGRSPSADCCQKA